MDPSHNGSDVCHVDEKTISDAVSDTNRSPLSRTSTDPDEH